MIDWLDRRGDGSRGATAHTQGGGKVTERLECEYVTSLGMGTGSPVLGTQNG